MKKFLTIVLTLLVGGTFLSGCGQTGGETTVTTSGTAGVSQSVSETSADVGNTDEIFVWEGTVITGLTEKGQAAEEIVIPDNATEIADSAFQFADMKTLTIGANVTKIGEYSFEKCKNLEAITIPSSVQTIGKYAFSYCQNVTTITFSEGLLEIGKGAFQALGAKTVTLPESLVTIGDQAFSPCAYVESIYIPSALENIPMGAFGLDSRWGKLYVKEGSWADLNYDKYVPADYNDQEKPSIEKAYY